jgi:hypothetical protein
MKSLIISNKHASSALTSETLACENQCFGNTGGVSPNNRHVGFQSAFLDCATGCVYLSRFADGNPAPMHLLDGLPDELVLQRDTAGRITVIKETVIAGFFCANNFYTREQAAKLMEGCVE